MPWHPTKRPRDAHSNLVSSSRLVPLRPQYYFRRSNGAIRMLLATAHEIRLISQVSCRMFRVTVHLVSSFSSPRRLTRKGMTKSNYRRAVSRSRVRGRGRASSWSILRICTPRREPAVDGDVGCPGVVPIVAPRRLAVNDNGSLSVFAISLNDRNHLRRLKFFLFDQGHVSAVIGAVVSDRTHDDRVV